MELESSVACYLEIRMSLQSKRGVLQLTDVAEVLIRVRDQDKNEALIDVTEQVIKSKEAMQIIESIGCDVFEDKRVPESVKKAARQFKSFKEQ